MIQSQNVPILVLCTETAEIVACNKAATELLGAERGDALFRAIPGTNVDRLKKRIAHGRVFTQFVDKRGPVPLSEVVVCPEEDGQCQLELIPAKGVRELQSMNSA